MYVEHVNPIANKATARKREVKTSEREEKKGGRESGRKRGEREERQGEREREMGPPLEQSQCHTTATDSACTQCGM